MIRFSCKWCGKRYRSRDDLAGTADYCNACGKPIWVPRKASSVSSVPSLHFSCPGCGKKYRTPVRYAGQTQTCRDCGTQVTAPPASAATLSGDSSPAMAPITPPPITPLPIPPPAAEPSVTDTSAPPFEIETPNLAEKLMELEAYLDLPPFELVPGAHDLPEAEFVPSSDSLPAVDGPDASPLPPPPRSSPTVVPLPPPPPPPPAPLAIPVTAPVATLVPPAAAPPPPPKPMIDTPPTPPPAPAPRAPEVRELPAPAPPARVEPPKQKGCRYCGNEGSYNLNARSPLGTLCMLLGAGGGLAALAGYDTDWRISIAAAPMFALAIWGAFMKRWTIICSKCERRLY